MTTLIVEETGDRYIDQTMNNAISQLVRDKDISLWDWTVTQAYILATCNNARKNPMLASDILRRWENQIQKVLAILPRIRQIESRAHCQKMVKDTKYFDIVWSTRLA